MEQGDWLGVTLAECCKEICKGMTSNGGETLMSGDLETKSNRQEAKLTSIVES